MAFYLVGKQATWVIILPIDNLAAGWDLHCEKKL